LKNSELKTARAWALKETAMALYGYLYQRPARKHFRWWHNWAVRSRLQPMIQVAGMLFRNKQNFVHAIYFHCGGLDMAPEATK
jgi:transposase